MPLAAFMEAANAHYYASRDPFGADGDFTTAPEISQMFGEILGLWCADAWQKMGAPSAFHLVELGPGRGTLMADALRAITAALPACRAALSVHLVETSPLLREKQEQNLLHSVRTEEGGRSLWRRLPSRSGQTEGIHWHDSISTLPPGPSIILANEFFDALPIRQEVLTPEGWRERFVGLEGENFVFDVVGAQRAAPMDSRFRGNDGHDDSQKIRESCPASENIIRALAPNLVAHGSALLAIDYGYEGPAFGDTLQAVQKHRFVPPLENPGEADLTAHVDFSALAEAAKQAGLAPHGPVFQGDFLKTLGIEARTQTLARANPAKAADIIAATNRLTGAGQMGHLFRVLALASPTLSDLAGFG